MSRSQLGGLLALLLGTLMLVAACGGKAPAPPTVQTPAETAAPAPALSPTPTPAPAPSTSSGTPFVYSAPVLGSADAPVTMIEYGDYQ